MSAEIKYNVPMETYLSDARLGSHSLALFDDLGPRMFIMRKMQMVDEEQSEALRFGQMFEDLVQGRAIDMSRFIVKPPGMSFSSQEGKAWRDYTAGCKIKNQDEFMAALASQGKELIEQEELDNMRWMHDSFLENESAMDTIRHAVKQATIVADDNPYGLKSRPDYMLDTRVTVDLKTTASLGWITSGKQVRERKYYVQAALARRMLRRATVHRDTEHYLLAVEKKMPYRCQLVPITNDWLDAGDRYIDRVRAQIATCADSGMWPRVLEEIGRLPPCPSWL